MATRTFAGTLSTAVETAGNWDIAPIAGDVLVFACTVNNAVCSTDMSGTVFAGYTVNAGKSLTMANGGTMSFTGTASAITGEVIVQTGGVLNLSDMTCTVTATTGTITMDGGTINLVRAAATTRVTVNGTITSTANVASGGIRNNANTTSGSYLQVGAGGSVSGFSATVKLPIDATVGASSTYGVWVSGARALVKWVDVLESTGSYGIYVTGASSMITGCTARGANAANLAQGGFRIEQVQVFLQDCLAYFCTSGISSWDSNIIARGCIFGQTEVGGAAANSQDLNVVATGPSMVTLRNSLLASATELATATAAPGFIISTGHDNDKTATGFKTWEGHPTANVWHLIAGEGTVLHTAGGKALSFVTASDTTAAENLWLRFPIALWPATHGDTLDVTLWVRSTGAGNKIKVIVDPDSIYGTAKQVEVTAGQADTYELATVPQYTVNTSVGTKSVIPVVVQIEEASKTWYVDDLSINGKAQTLDYGAYDGVLPIESIGAGGIGKLIGGGLIAAGAK